MKSTNPISRGQIANVFKEYETITALLADQANQSSNRIYKVIDASLDTNITFPSGETKLHAYYEYKETPNGVIGDYDLIGAPYADGGSGSGGGVQSVTGDGVSGTPEDVVLTFPTPTDIGAIEDAPSDGKTYGRKDGSWEEIIQGGGGGDFNGITISDTDEILLTGNGVTGNSLKANLTTEVLNKLNNGQTAFGWGNHANAGYLTQHQDISEKEDKVNKVTNLNSPNDTEYPTTKAVQTAIENIEVYGIQEGADSNETIKYLSIKESEGDIDDTIYFVDGHELFDYGQLDIKKFPGNVEEFAEAGDRVEGFVRDVNNDLWYLIGKYVTGDEMLLESYELLNGTTQWQ